MRTRAASIAGSMLVKTLRLLKAGLLGASHAASTLRTRSPITFGLGDDCRLQQLIRFRSQVNTTQCAFSNMQEQRLYNTLRPAAANHQGKRQSPITFRGTPTHTCESHCDIVASGTVRPVSIHELRPVCVSTRCAPGMLNCAAEISGE